MSLQRQETPDENLIGVAGAPAAAAARPLPSRQSERADVRARQALDMENLVAVAVALEDGAERFFLTWGRIQDTIDDHALTALVLRNAPGFDLGGIAVSARVCRNLQEARNGPYFFEALFDLANEGIPFGRRYNRWRRRVADEMEHGKHLWYLGR